jgi:hypothetical protein
VDAISILGTDPAYCKGRLDIKFFAFGNVIQLWSNINDLGACHLHYMIAIILVFGYYGTQIVNPAPLVGRRKCCGVRIQASKVRKYQLERTSLLHWITTRGRSKSATRKKSCRAGR